MDMDIIIVSIIITGLIAGFFGFVIGMCNYFFATKEDDNSVSEVTEMLPGINCGSCGYPGCEAFAKALVDGETTVELCRPSKDSQKKKIVEYITKK